MISIRLSTLVLALLVSVSTLAQIPQPASHSTPKHTAQPSDVQGPQRVYKITQPSDPPALYPSSRRLVVTPHLLLVDSYDLPARRYVAFDRSTGKELWHKENNENKVAGEAAQWTLVGVAHNTTANEMIVLQRSLLTRQEQGAYHVQTATLQGVEARTGKVIWHYPLTATRRVDDTTPAGVFGGVVVMTYAQDVLTDYLGTHRHVQENIGRVDFLDAFTGVRMDPASGKGKAALQSAAKQNSSPLAFLKLSNPYYLLHLDSGALIPLPVSGVPEFPGRVSKADVTARYVLMHLVTDDDGAGHSQWPNYLYALDSSGRKAWQFPQTLIYPGTGEVSPEEEQRAYETIEHMLVVPDADMVLATGSRHFLYGLQASTGKVVWQDPPGSLGVLSLAAYGKGAFVLATREGTAAPDLPRSLGYIEATTGRLSWLTDIPSSQHIVVEGEELFVVVGSDRVYAYSCPQLLEASRKR